MRPNELPTNAALWAECYENEKAAHPYMEEAELHELTEKSYEYNFLEKSCEGEPFKIDIQKTLDEFFSDKWK